MNNEELEKIVRDFFEEYIVQDKSSNEWFKFTAYGRYKEKIIQAEYKLRPRHTIIVSGQADNWEEAQDNFLYKIQLIKDRYDHERKEKVKTQKKEKIKG